MTCSFHAPKSCGAGESLTRASSGGKRKASCAQCESAGVQSGTAYRMSLGPRNRRPTYFNGKRTGSMRMTIWRSLKQQLAQRDRWRVEDMLREQPDLLAKDPRRDMELWRHLFAPDDLVRVGNVLQGSLRSRVCGMVLGEYLERAGDGRDCDRMLVGLGSPSGHHLQRANEP